MSSIEKAINKLGEKKALSEKKPSSGPVPDKSQNQSVEKKKIIENKHSTSIIGLDNTKLERLGMIVPGNSESQIGHEFRRIKRPLIANAFGEGRKLVDHGNLIMVTSALPGEGKSFSSINLAISIAMEVDRTVLLIDADNARAGISKVLEFDPGLGLADLLTDNTLDVSDVVYKTSMPNLSILSAGSHKQNMTELFASQAMKELILDISTRYSDRIIIFDSSPLSLTTEAEVLTSLVGQILLVVEANKTPQQVIKNALRNIAGDKTIGVILNKTLSYNESNYGYGYGYGYGDRG